MYVIPDATTTATRRDVVSMPLRRGKEFRESLVGGGVVRRMMVRLGCWKEYNAGRQVFGVVCTGVRNWMARRNVKRRIGSQCYYLPHDAFLFLACSASAVVQHKLSFRCKMTDSDKAEPPTHATPTAHATCRCKTRESNVNDNNPKTSVP